MGWDQMCTSILHYVALPDIMQERWDLRIVAIAGDSSCHRQH